MSIRKDSGDDIDIEQELEKYLSERQNTWHKKEHAKKGTIEVERHVSSPRRWFSEGLRRIRKVSIGYKLNDKFRLIEMAFVELIPSFIRRKHYTVDPLLTSVAEHLCSNLTIKVNNTIYALRDCESMRILSSEFEPFMSQWFQPEKGDVVVDVGSHLGKYAIEAAMLVGSKGIVVAIEAIPANFSMLKKNIELNRLENVVAFNLAAWNSKCSLQFLVGSTSANSNISRYNYEQGKIEVQAERTDKLLIEQLDLNRVDWIKIDVEGAEYEVLLGLEETLSRFKPIIIVEIWSQNMAKVKAFLKKHRYRIIKLSEFGHAQSQYYIEALCVHV